MKRIFVCLMALATVLAMSACSAGKMESPSSATPFPSGASDSSAGMLNLWTNAATAQEAADGAGVVHFQLPEEGTDTGDGAVTWREFRYMSGLAEARGGIGTATLTVRKGQQNADVSGDYSVYSYKWIQEVEGRQVTCSGNEEGRAMKAIWIADFSSYSMLVRGEGDAYSTYGVDAETLETLVKAIQ
ncbi:MAG: hypothetical protein K6B40_03725 [Firmicutes bacterium]|nr:hypothetical protein [Bacillota bacterium]